MPHFSPSLEKLIFGMLATSETQAGCIMAHSTISARSWEGAPNRPGGLLEVGCQPCHTGVDTAAKRGQDQAVPACHGADPYAPQATMQPRNLPPHMPTQGETVHTALPQKPGQAARDWNQRPSRILAAHHRAAVHSAMQPGRATRAQRVTTTPVPTGPGGGTRPEGPLVAQSCH